MFTRFILNNSLDVHGKACMHVHTFHCPQNSLLLSSTVGNEEKQDVLYKLVFLKPSLAFASYLVLAKNLNRK